MPQAKSGTNHIKQTPQTINSDNGDELDRYEDEAEEIHGGGAAAKYSNDHPDRVKAQDRDMGAGKSRKVMEVGS